MLEKKNPIYVTWIRFPCLQCVIPLVRPVKDEVSGNKRRSPEEDLAIESPPDVEDGVVGSVGQGVLSVGGETVGNDTLLGLTTYSDQ